MTVRFLIVDDHEPIRRGIRSLLASHAGWSVCGEAGNGVEATEMARHLRPDVILMDLSMPRMDGAEATRIIRREVPKAEVIIVTQNDPEMARRQVSEIGARAYVSKTTLARDLLPAILDIIGDPNGGRPMEVRERPASQAEHSTALLAAIVDSSDDAIVSKDLDGIITSWNRAAERIFGYTAREAIGQYITLIIPLDRRHEENEILSRLRQGERIDHFETVRQRKDGTLVDISVTISPVRDASGHIIGASKVARDITEHRRAEKALRESEQRFRLITEASPVMVWMSGTDKLCYYFNKGWLEFVGRTLEQESGNGWAENVHPDDYDRCLQIYVRCFDARRSFQMEYRLRHHTGQYRWILDHGVPRYAPDGTFEGYMGGCLDIHDQKTANEELRESESRLRVLSEKLDSEVQARTSELEQKNRDLQKQTEQVRELSWHLLHTQDEERRHIARELHDSAGQTLAVLSMNLSALVENIREKAPEILQPAEETNELVLQLTKDIRTTSYLLHPPLLDENGLPSALSWYVAGLTERSGLDISFSISEEFGRLPREMELVVFRLVQECLTNIHRHSGSKSASIQVIREPDRVLVEVRDQGRGMSREKLAEIQSGGSGVGIRGMRERLRQFRGEMLIDSTTAGTTVLVTIPLTGVRSIEETTGRFKTAV